MSVVKKQLVLNKGSEKFIFRYDSGCEGHLLDSLVSQAMDETSTFDWFDAAVLSFKLTQSLIGEADKIIYKDMPNPLQSYIEYE